MSGFGHLYALMALDEADRAQRVASARERADEGLDPARSEARASAWSRWLARRESDGTADARAPKQVVRRAAHI